MTRDELDATLEKMTAAATPDQGPGLITVESNHWVHHLSVVRATCSALHDGLRYRNIQLHVSSTFETKVLSRAEAGERGAPYRELTPQIA
ncbi:hypothetical protein [Brevundimonas bullata]